MSGVSETDSTARPLLSVGLPVYNGLPYLEETLRSLLAERIDGLEIVICDNASTDGSWELICDHARSDERVVCVRNERNIGASRNYNKVFRLARGKYFRWGASDDLTSPGALEACVRALEADPDLFLAFPRTVLIDARGVSCGEYDDGDGWEANGVVERFAYSLTRWGYCNVVLGVMRADLLAQTVLLGDYPASDLVLQGDLALRGRFKRIDHEYYYRRVHDRCTNALDAAALAQFYEPDRRTSFEAKLLRMFRELSRVVWNVPAPVSQKRQMYAALARQLVWSRRAIAAELAAVLHLSPGAV